MAFLLYLLLTPTLIVEAFSLFALVEGHSFILTAVLVVEFG